MRLREGWGSFMRLETDGEGGRIGKGGECLYCLFSAEFGLGFVDREERGGGDGKVKPCLHLVWKPLVVRKSRSCAMGFWEQLDAPFHNTHVLIWRVFESWP
jgi:hypothetical protein